MNTIRLTPKTLHAAEAYFAETDPVIATLLARAKTHSTPLTLPTPTAPKDYFAALASTIISQQISTAAAKTITSRVYAALRTITPDTILTGQNKLTAAGVSPQKLRYLNAMAERWPQLKTDKFDSLPDKEIIEELTSIPGIGVWSAEMFLLFTLRRSNIYSPRDLGLAQSLLYYYQLRPHYNRKIAAVIETWSPYRSVASLTLWHARDTKAPLPATT